MMMMSKDVSAMLLARSRRRLVWLLRHCEKHLRRSNPAFPRRTGLLRFARNDGVKHFSSHHHHDGVFDQHLEGADQFGAERAVDRAVIARQGHAHDVRGLDLAAAYYRALLAGA